MIRECRREDFNKVIKYIFEKNAIAEYAFDTCPNEMEGIQQLLEEAIDKNDMKIIVSYEEKNINGVALLPCNDIENDCIGIFTTSSFKDIAMSMFQYVKDTLKGKSYYLYVNEQNKHIEELKDYYKVNDLGKDMTLVLDTYSDSFINSYIQENKQEDSFEEFKEDFAVMHDELFPDIYWSSKRILESLDDWKIILENNQDILIGYVILVMNKDNIYIQQIGVKEEYRKNGYGHKLIRRVMNYAAMNRKSLILDVETDNTSAISLYKSLGFKTVKVKHLYQIKF
ncbi:GNAT family N-acetyltransferase [Anaeromicropila herbilytica]|uniref:N-acetyltransferase domain-containing protein n=1 Tax=Anaeromicropila herbilytica TaxID=2785025 RepID=A0A7R7ICH3_9FIRM|nr:GNAT family N-acetyltransferase [Anaeromicropila herbilytica]BCN30607.1 hypothetical protein bsdtb5_19020 [Anaeromicropila herbilytica]